ncbi:MAG: hypothetical protein ABSG98_12875 [Anaerolineales bacterium]|jgi:hypothetical protein
MPGFVDPKGKHYTAVVQKRAIPARIQTTRQLIQGKVHAPPDQRVTDELDSPQRFLAVTEAQVFDDQGRPIGTFPFLSVNKTQIVWLAPADGSTTEAAG